MDRQEKEKWIDKLLIYAKDELEDQGKMISLSNFYFSEGSEHSTKFLQDKKMSFVDFESIVKICISRNYLKQAYSTGNALNGLRLTEYGQGRALSALLAKEKPADSFSNYTIGAIYNHGPSQIGDHNTQNIEIVFKELVEKIDNADAPEKEKQEAKNRLQTFLEHPLVGTALGVGVQTLLASLGLGG
jgi:hypothetical protein